ncbi:uncharacterized protein LOC131952182 [Physella acuta]|uniref:uncharacterized protein LOC131952182 n=1 Tax=Physella acuta TaxID=109671 RepID=UPI0027DE8306|nr:uncharacterized protein LOC131952182 [Physella acuta]
MLSALSQIFLLLWKNILLRYRHPSILLLELVWPVALVGLLSLMREGIPPIKYKDCQYPARAMPSVGVTSFLQGFICNLDNHCFTSQTTLSLTEQTTKNFEALTRDVAPYFGSNETIEILSFSDKSAGLFTPLKKVVQDDELMTGLANLTLVSNYFRDPSVIVNILANEFKILTRAQATALMNSKIKIGMLLNLTGAPDLKGIVCDPKLLGSYLLFPVGTDVSRISAALCAVGDTKVSNLTNAILQNMNVTSFIYAVQLLEDIKEKFGDNNAMNLVFGDVAQMFETIMASKTVVGLIGSIASIDNVSEIIRSIPSWIVGLNDFNSAISLIKNIVGSLDPVMASLHLQNTSAWMAIKNIAQLGINFIELGEGKWNGTTKEFMAPITELMSDLKDLAGEESGKILFGTMDLLSKIDLIGIYDQLYKTGTLTESTTINMLSNFQELMENLSCWPTVQKMVILIQHTADIMSVFTEKSLELKQALKLLLDSNQVLVQQLNRIFTYGPVVTRAVFQEMMDKTLLTDVIKTGNTYSTVCERIVGKIQMNPDIPANIYQDLHDILCSGEVMDAFTTLMERIHLADIALIINSTVKDIEVLYNGQLFNKSVTFTAAYVHVKQFVDSVNSYRSVGYLWADLFKDVSSQSIDVNQAGWEMVRDMLNTDFLTTGLLSVTKALGQVLADSSASNFMSTYIHILSHAVQLFDNTVNSLTTAYQSGSPFPSAISLLTSYMPDIVRGIKYLWDNKMQSIYTLVTSADPLVTFCTGNYFGQMDFAPYVPVMEMTSLVCNTSWPMAANDFIQPVTNIIKSMTQIVEAFNSSATASYDFVSDWGDLIDHAQKILGVFNSGQLQTMDFTMGYKTFVENLDLMKFAEGFQVLFQTLQGMTVADIDKLTNLTAKVMERLDSALSRYSTWDDAKLYIAIFEAFVDGEINMTKEYTTGYSSLREILDKYPPELRTFTVLLSDAYPELISALKMMILDPSKLIGKFLTGGFSAPDCKSSFVTDYLSAPANSSLHALEDFLCHLDLVALAEKVANSQPSMQGYSQKLTALINGPVTREQINWQILAEKIKTLILQLSSMHSLKDSNYLGFDFSPFNFTTIGLSWKEFYTAANTLKNFDINKFIPLIYQIQEFALGLSKSTSTDISLDLQTYAYVSHHFLKMVNAELAFFNASSEVIVSEYLWSPELHKLFDALNKSPDLTAVFLATLQRLLVSPSQVFWPSNIESVCSDLQLFSQTFVVGVSMASPAALQSTVCGLNIDVMLVVEQVQNNRPSVKEFIDAMKLLSTSYTADEVSVDFKTLMSEYEMMNSLIRDLTSHPPVVKLTPDQQWMDVNVYLSLWGDFSQQLLTLGAELQIESKLLSWQSELSQLLLSTVEKMSGTGPALGYINGILEILQKHISILKDGYDSFKSYPNVNQMLKIVQSAPQAVETVLYTVLTEPVKTKTWSSIFQSWDLFCQTPAGDFMTVPEGLNFDITDFFGRICQVDFVEMGHELAQFEAVNELNALFTTPSEENVNVSSLYNKLGLIIQSLQAYTTEPNSAKEIAFAQLFNATLWEQIGNHITIWSSTSVKIFSDPEKITGLALEILKIVLGSLPQGYQSVYNQMVGITDIILGKVINIFNSTKLSEVFSEQPDLKLLAGLLEDLPQLYEVAVYTNLYYPEKITAKTPYFSSMEAFCANTPQEMFMVPPSSTFDLRAWFNRLCSVNVTSLIEELGDYSMSKEIEKVLNNPLSEPVDISSIISNFQKLMEKLNSGFSINDPLFSTDIWENAMKNVEKWILPYSALSDFLKDTPLRVLKVVTSLLEKMPTSNSALNYIDAIFSLIGNRVEEAQANGLPAAFTDLPSLKTILKLAEGMPDLVETLIYTTLTQPVKTANWVAAFQSFSTFCGTSVQDILVLPPGSSFDLEGYIQQICSIDIGQVATEITTFEGFRRIEAIVTGNDYNVVNTSSILEQANRIIQSLGYIYDNPSSFAGLDLRIFSETAWKTMWQRVEKWSPTAVAKYQDTNTLVDIFELVFGPLAEMSPELKSAYNKAMAITDVVVDEVFMVLNSSSISEAYNSIPVLKQLFKMANQAPELLETLLYTSMFHPDKLGVDWPAGLPEKKPGRPPGKTPCGPSQMELYEAN